MWSFLHLNALRHQFEKSDDRWNKIRLEMYIHEGKHAPKTEITVQTIMTFIYTSPIKHNSQINISYSAV